MTTIQKEGLVRSVPFLVRDEDSDSGDGLTLTGHAAVFNQETEINSWEGRFLESISPGAFRKTIRERTPVLQFDHGRHPLVGSIPIGSIQELKEDDQGLYVEARMADNWLIEPVRDAIKNKSVNGMSFRFEVIREKWEDKDGKEIKDQEELWRLLWDAGERGPIKRTLKEVKVHELGPVVFPAYSGTDVDLRSKELAELVLKDDALRQEVRSALALERLPAPLPDLKDIGPDTELRRNVARHILFGTPSEPKQKQITINVDVSANPEEWQENIINALRSYHSARSKPAVILDTKTQDEPSDSDTHPNTNDAPLRDGHPSKEVSPHLRAQIQSAQKRMKLRLGYVTEDN